MDGPKEGPIIASAAKRILFVRSCSDSVPGFGHHLGAA